MSEVRSKIVDAAKTLDDLLMFNGEGECPVSHEEAQLLWDATYKEGGFAAVRGFLNACSRINAKETKS